MGAPQVVGFFDHEKMDLLSIFFRRSLVTQIFSGFFSLSRFTCQVLLMGIFRALLLSFAFALAVKLGLGLWNCGTQGPEARPGQW